MPREAKTKIRMCRACSGDMVDQFKALLGDRENTVFEEKCVGSGKCGTETPFLKFEKGKDKKILEAATVEELFAQIG